MPPPGRDVEHLPRPQQALGEGGVGEEWEAAVVGAVEGDAAGIGVQGVSAGVEVVGVGGVVESDVLAAHDLAEEVVVGVGVEGGHWGGERGVWGCMQERGALDDSEPVASKAQHGVSLHASIVALHVPMIVAPHRCPWARTTR